MGGQPPGRRSGLGRPKNRPWSAQEEAYLEANFRHSSAKALARRLGRSPTAVKLKAKRLGLRKYGALPPALGDRESTRRGGVRGNS